MFGQNCLSSSLWLLIINYQKIKTYGCFYAHTQWAHSPGKKHNRMKAVHERIADEMIGVWPVRFNWSMMYVKHDSYTYRKKCQTFGSFYTLEEQDWNQGIHTYNLNWRSSFPAAWLKILHLKINLCQRWAENRLRSTRKDPGLIHGRFSTFRIHKSSSLPGVSWLRCNYPAMHSCFPITLSAFLGFHSRFPTDI